MQQNPPFPTKPTKPFPKYPAERKREWTRVCIPFPKPFDHRRIAPAIGHRLSLCFHSASRSVQFQTPNRFVHASQNYNTLSYDDKILDGFYDLYGILMESTSSTMPSLVDLQGTPVTDNITWEAVLVNRAADAKLLRLEQKALEMVVKSKSESLNFVGNDLVKKLACLVSDHMGGPVGDPESMLLAWRGLSYKLKATLGSMVLPLGSLKVGLTRHRALLFKVLADSVGIPSRLVKGQQYTGSSDVAMSFVKIGDGSV